MIISRNNINGYEKVKENDSQSTEDDWIELIEFCKTHKINLSEYQDINPKTLLKFLKIKNGINENPKSVSKTLILG
jgi:hypothetical protein